MTITFRHWLFVASAFLCLSFAAPAQDLVTIAAVQGDKGESPLVDKQVMVHGIVTARKQNGIFIQTPDADVDKNPLTSEGIFVYVNQNDPFDGAIGDMVEVTATVQEYRPRNENYGFSITELTRATIKSISSKNALPAPITLTSNDLVPNKLDTLERYEGMRVRIDTLNVVAPTGGRTDEKTWVTRSDGVFFGVLPGVARPVREAGVEYFYHVGQKLAQTVPLFDTNPEMLRVDSDALSGAKPIDVTAGATVKNLVGVIDYSYRRYTFDVDPSTPPTVEGNKSFTAVSAAGDREMTVGCFNIERFFDDEKNGAPKEVVAPKEHVLRRLNKASLAIRKVLAMPDVLGVEEVENLKVLKRLAAKINADAVADGNADPKYEAYLEEGNDIGGIDSGFLVKSTKVKVIETKQLAKNESLNFSGASGENSLFDRPPFLIRVQAIDSNSTNPLTVTVIVNHIKSYLGIDSDKDGPRVREKRRQEAEWLANFVAERAKLDPTEKLIVCGDLNAFLFNDGYNDLIGTLKGKPNQTVTNPSKTFVTNLYDLADFMADPKSKYSYVHEGSTQVLDHLLLNKPLLSWTANKPKFGYARVDADFPVAWAADDTRPERLSDHDAPVVFLSLDPPGTIYLPMAVPSGVPVGNMPATTPVKTVPDDDPPPPPPVKPRPKPFDPSAYATPTPKS